MFPGEESYSQVLVDDLLGNGRMSLLISTMSGNVYCFATPIPYKPLAAWSAHAADNTCTWPDRTSHSPSLAVASWCTHIIQRVDPCHAMCCHMSLHVCACVARSSQVHGLNGFTARDKYVHVHTHDMCMSEHIHVLVMSQLSLCVLMCMSRVAQLSRYLCDTCISGVSQRTGNTGDGMRVAWLLLSARVHVSLRCDACRLFASMHAVTCGMSSPMHVVVIGIDVPTRIRNRG